MSYEQRDNSGSLFRNETKTNERGPDYSGTCMVDGVEHFFDGWLKTADSGKKWMSFSFKRKEKQPQAPAAPARQQPPQRGHRYDDDGAPPF